VARVTVPDIVGLTKGGAENALSSAGLKSTAVSRKQPGGWKKHKGRVWKQSPSSGARVESGSTVTFWVNPG
ncbi:MAG: PASTA domain-containing protein, partial [Actinomycetota bacterium]|nr:PASTA domain-containing protein [Actinomycetota bacterium]